MAFDSESEYAAVVYEKTALWMYLMERTISKEKIDEGMQSYFRNWKFKHPYPEDMESSLEQQTQIGLRSIFALLQTKGPFR